MYQWVSEQSPLLAAVSGGSGRPFCATLLPVRSRHGFGGARAAAARLNGTRLSRNATAAECPWIRTGDGAQTHSLG